MVQRKGKRKAGDVKKKSLKAKITNKMNSTRRLSRMGKKQKKGHRGIAAAFVTRSQAIRQLQMTLKDFRRLCILKGIYPREPRKKPGSGKDKTYYHVKDVTYLSHEPLLDKFREFKAFMKKLRTTVGKGTRSEIDRKQAVRPEYTLDHIVKERYPTFPDALEDLDDALCMIHLFAQLPQDRQVKAARTLRCEALCREWAFIVARTRSLTKCFVSIKGFYYQANVLGVDITWLVPHRFPQELPDDVDFRIMNTFLEFYETLIKFINYKLFVTDGLQYPPRLSAQRSKDGCGIAALKLMPTPAARASGAHALNAKQAAAKKKKRLAQGADGEAADAEAAALQAAETAERIKTLPKQQLAADAGPGGMGGGGAAGGNDSDNDDEALLEPLEEAFAQNEEAQQIALAAVEHAAAAKATRIYDGMHFLLGRECAVGALELVINAFGGQVNWQGDGSGLQEADERFTHRISDRPVREGAPPPPPHCELLQPQWVFDSANAAMLLPVARYAPGAALPPHLSPFVDDEAEGYVPDYRQELQKLKSARDVAATGGLNEDGVDSDDSADDDGSEDEEEDEVEGDEARYVRELAAEMAGKSVGEEGADGSDDDGSEDGSEEEEEEEEEEVKPKLSAKKRKAKEAEEEEHKLALTMMPKKAKRLYDRMQHGIGKKADVVASLEAKRDEKKRATKKSRSKKQA